MFGFLSEREVDRILEAGGVFRDTPRWVQRVENAHWVQFGGFVDSPVDAGLRLNMTVSLRRPDKYTIAYLRGDQTIRRLDVRGSHVNPAIASGERWVRHTHKHRWSDRHADQIAYSPPDISTPEEPEPDEHERVFNEFCSECRIRFEGNWAPPPLHHQTRLDIG